MRGLILSVLLLKRNFHAKHLLLYDYLYLPR